MDNNFIRRFDHSFHFTHENTSNDEQETKQFESTDLSESDENGETMNKIEIMNESRTKKLSFNNILDNKECLLIYNTLLSLSLSNFFINKYKFNIPKEILKIIAFNTTGTIIICKLCNDIDTLRLKNDKICKYNCNCLNCKNKFEKYININININKCAYYKCNNIILCCNDCIKLYSFENRDDICKKCVTYYCLDCAKLNEKLIPKHYKIKNKRKLPIWMLNMYGCNKFCYECGNIKNKKFCICWQIKH